MLKKSSLIYRAQLELASANPNQEGLKSAYSTIKNLLALGLFAFLLLGIQETLTAQDYVAIGDNTALNQPANPYNAYPNSTIGKTPLIETLDIFKEDVFCWRETYGRGVGTVPTICQNGMELDAGLCYKLCKEGYYGVGPVCWANCPEGFRDDGAFCAKPESYGRGAGYAVWDLKICEEKHGKGNCEQYGAIWYPKCKEGYYAAGCCVCSPICPEGWTDIGVSCAKPSYGRGVGVVPTGCANGKEYDAGLCYTACKPGYRGIGPVCWEVTCPNINGKQWVDCGAGCAQTTNTCATAVIDMVTTPLIAVLNIAGMIVTGGGSGAATAGAGAATGGAAAASAGAQAVTAYTSAGKAITFTTKVVSGATNVTKQMIENDLIAKAKEQLNGKPMSEQQKKGIEEYASMAYDASRTTTFDWRDFTAIDPTGLASVAAAYANPLCRDLTSSNPGACRSGEKKGTDGRCYREVKFHSQNSLTLQQAKDKCAANGWRLASEQEVLSAWNNLGLDVYAYAMMADGRFAVPVQVNHSNFSKGANIGAVGGNQGFLYVIP